jgi:hypothetical protein
MFYYEAEVQVTSEAQRSLGPRPKADDRVGLNVRFGSKTYSGYAVVGTEEIRPGEKRELRLIVSSSAPDLHTGDVVDLSDGIRYVGVARIHKRVEGDWRMGKTN